MSRRSSVSILAVFESEESAFFALKNRLPAALCKRIWKRKEKNGINEGMGKRIRLLKPADIIILILAGAAVFFAAIPAKKSEGALSVEVQGPSADGRRYLVSYPLAENRTFSVGGREGEITIEIADGSAFVASSPCKNRICVLSPPLTSEGEWIACVPGEVIIRIVRGGAKKNPLSLDAIVY